jgi:putative transposase
MAAIERKTKRYPTDLTDQEWERIAPLLPKPARRGRKPDWTCGQPPERVM